MTKSTDMRLHRIFNVFVAAFVFVTGACLAAACLYIYYGLGEYTRETVINVFSYISIPVYVSIALMVAGFIYELVSPLKEKKSKVAKDNAHICKKLSLKKDLSECDKALSLAIAKERRNRKLHYIIRAVLIVLCAAAFLSFALDFSNYHATEINDSMIFMMTVLAPCLAICGGYSVFVEFYLNRSLKKEIELLKKIPDKKGEASEKAKNEKAACVVVTVARVIVVVIAVAALVCGAVEGGFSDVLTKAVNICTECIGLG